MKKIYLSPSLQSDNKYAYGDYTEAQVCRKICEYEKKALERNGYTVKLATAGYNISQRINESNAWGAEIHQPLHTNAGGGDGTLVMCWSGYQNDKYIKSIYQSLASYTPTKDDGIKVNTSLAEVSQTNAMCVYIEAEFHDNSTTAKWIVNNMKGIAEAIVKGYCKADGKTYKAESSTIVPAGTKGMYKVQIGAFQKKSNAEALGEKASKLGYDAYIYSANGVYRVQIGAFKDKKNADNLAGMAKKNGFDTYVYQE